MSKNRCSCGAPEPCIAPRFGGRHVPRELWDRDDRPIQGPMTAEQWLRSIYNIRLTPAGKRAVELYRAGMSEKQIEQILKEEGYTNDA